MKFGFDTSLNKDNKNTNSVSTSYTNSDGNFEQSEIIKMFF